MKKSPGSVCFARDDDEFVGPIQAPRYNNYLQSSLTQSRYFPTGIGSDGDLTVVSIPSKLFGENIVPSTFDLTYTSSGDLGFNIVAVSYTHLTLPTTPYV